MQPFPQAGGRFQVSKTGGSQALWRGDGKELFFLGLDGMMAVTIDTTREFQAGIPQTLFLSGAAAAGARRQYAVTRDGKRFLILMSRSSERNASSQPLAFVLNSLAVVQK